MINRLNYAYNEIKENYQDSYWWRLRFESRVVGAVQQHVYGNDGIDVMNEDWDTLLVIDACRADIFENVTGGSDYDVYRTVKSKASATPEWMQRTFANREFGDTVYVSANPWISKIAPEGFHDIYNIWLEAYDIDSEDLQSVETLGELGIEAGASITAETVNETVRKAKEEHPNKRIIAHYFQPHAPYIGNTDGTLKENPSSIHPGKPLARGMVNKKDVWKEYCENLKYVLVHTDELTAELPGKTVVTSDHGELFGEWMTPFPVRGYAHPIGLRHPAITKVPWAERTNGDRPNITDDGVRSVYIDEDAANAQLRALGYMEPEETTGE